MKDFFVYFFGAGTEVEFSNFTLPHFAPIILMGLVIFLIYHFREQLQTNEKLDLYLRYAMGFVMIVSEMSYYWRLVGDPSLNPNPVDHLPITVCGWCIVFCSYMIIGKSQTLFDIAYFWLFSGTLFALITPTVITYTGITRFRYYQFWLEHTMGYIAVFYMIFVHKFRPTVKSLVKSYIALLVLAVIAYAANTMIGNGANYLFMASPEDTKSVLDILPANFAVRLLIMASVITALFVGSYLPWYFKDRKEKIKEQTENE